ncbi:hypothetical protein BCR44DRAFT_37074 [Catenaria anguillulae PL171]|uniref:Uncharacterized protein n=1 Tax=Catenaria anguillulae PL171 TaxID=765915 RepID=A0A1Y2HWC0_9FUNG|nr:hypothetical protein BCR44DRAFT_37074 [Catenaria anguillulae PL171]
MHLFDARAKPDLYAVIPLGFFIQAEKVHADVAQDSRSSSINKLVFHKCLALLFNQRYQDAAIRGIRVRMPTGTWYQGFPRLLYYVGDLPELALFTLTRQGQACPACFTMAPNFMQRVPNLTCRDQKEMEILVENMSACTAAVQTEVGQIMGIHLLYNGLWACPYSNVYQSVVVDELHQLFIGVFGRHLCGAIMKEIDSLADLRTRFYNRLRAVPDFSSSPFRGLTASSFALLTGAEWRALCNVFPSLLIGLFVDELKNDICVAIFALFAEFVHLVCVPNVSETAIAQATQTLDLFFRHLPRFLTAFSHTPDALTFHTLNHFLPCIPRIGSSRHTSTATQMEIHHKNNAKGPAKHTNKHGAIETDTLRRLLIQNALVDHFVFLVLFHPIQRRLYALKSMAQLVQAIEASRPLIPNALPRPHFAQPASPSVSYPTNVPVQLPMRKPNQ